MDQNTDWRLLQVNSSLQLIFLFSNNHFESCNVEHETEILHGVYKLVPHDEDKIGVKLS